MNKETALCIRSLRKEFGCTWRKIAGIMTNDENPDQLLGENYCNKAMKVLGEGFE